MDRPKNILVFGYGLSLILLLLGLRASEHQGRMTVSIILMVLSILLIILTLWKIDYVRVIYIRWMKAAHVIGSIVTTILLSIIYYFLFGTIAMILRILKKDFLDRGLKPSKASYWQRKTAQPFDKKRYTQQF